MRFTHVVWFNRFDRAASYSKPGMWLLGLLVQALMAPMMWLIVCGNGPLIGMALVIIASHRQEAG